MWKEVQRTRKKEVQSSHFVESSRPSRKTVRLEVFDRDIHSGLSFNRPQVFFFN